ncbi:MAG: hypothetical protein Q8N47_27715 [Bryobacterales bacterium]|nr:hypothetical protein [Bryobacterales bacterium]
MRQTRRSFFLAAGKDVYVEKPLCQTPEQGVELVADQGADVYDGIHLLVSASYPPAVTAASCKPHEEGYDTPEPVVITAEYPDGEEKPAIGKTSPKGFGCATDPRVASFLECVRTRKKPTASVALGFQAALVVQLANISLKSGRSAKWSHGAGKVEV